MVHPNRCMPEGDTILRAARALHRALAGARGHPLRLCLSGRDEGRRRPPDRRPDDRIGVGARQASADGVFRRPRAAHAHAHERELAPLPARRAVAAPRARHAGPRRDRGRRRGRIQRPDRRAPLEPADWNGTRRFARSARTCWPARASDTQYAVDTAEIVRRMRAGGRDAIADVLLNQRVVAGIGNVFKSEILFVAGIDPFAPVVSLSDADLERIDRRRARSARGERARSLEDAGHGDRPPDDPKPRSERDALGLQPRGQAVPALRHGHPFEEDRAGCAGSRTGVRSARRRIGELVNS